VEAGCTHSILQSGLQFHFNKTEAIFVIINKFLKLASIQVLLKDNEEISCNISATRRVFPLPTT
jgi:hypothetical protein